MDYNSLLYWFFTAYDAKNSTWPFPLGSCSIHFSREHGDLVTVHHVCDSLLVNKEHSKIMTVRRIKDASRLICRNASCYEDSQADSLITRFNSLVLQRKRPQVSILGGKSRQGEELNWGNKTTRSRSTSFSEGTNSDLIPHSGILAQAQPQHDALISPIIIPLSLVWVQLQRNKNTLQSLEFGA